MLQRRQLVHIDCTEGPGGPTRADEAIEAFISENYAGSAATNFTVAGAASESANYVFEADGRLLGRLHALKIGDSWYVALEICSSQLSDHS